MIDKEQIKKYPVTKGVFEYIRKNDALFVKTLDYIYEYLDEKYLFFSEGLLTILKKKCVSEEKFTASLEAVIKFSREFLMLQAKLNMDGRYLHSSFEEVNDAVYQSEKMNDYYLDGLFLTQVLWPNHYKIVCFFLEQKKLADSSSRILDVACGAGTYTYQIARFFNYSYLRAVDISPHSVSYTEDILRHSLLASDRCADVTVSDIYKFNDAEGFDFIVCSELLEHVANPEQLFDKLSSIQKNKGRIFLTTAIYAAEIDHIYLFNNVDEVRKLLKKYFRIISELILPISLKEFTPGMNKVPINYACVLGKIA